MCLDRTERLLCVCVQEHPDWAICITQSSVDVALEIETWRHLSCSHWRTDVSAMPFLLVRWEPFARELFPQILRKQRRGLFVFSGEDGYREKWACRHVVSPATSV